MPLKDIDVKSAIDELYKKYSGNRTDYITLRTELETINKMILNQAANVYYDSSDMTYAAVNRKDKELAGIEKNFAKDRLYGIVLYTLERMSRYVYIDVPGKTPPILDPDIFYTEPDLELSKYKEYLFEADGGDYLSIPVVGGIASVKVPYNFPEHIYTNPEDAVFLNMKRPDILVRINDAAQTARVPLTGFGGLGIVNSPSAPVAASTSVIKGSSEFISGAGLRPGALNLCGGLRIDTSKGASVNPKGSSRMLNSIGDNDFIKVVNEIANKYGIPPALVLALFYNESAATMSPSICNDLGYCGLFQLGKSGRKQFGVSRENFTSMSISEQTKFFRDRYLPYWFPNWENPSYAKKNPLSIGNFYAAVFLPAGRFFSEDEILTSMYPDRLKYSWQNTSHYTHNRILDYDGDGSITIKDLENRLIKVANDIRLVGGGDGRGKTGCPERETGVS